jgi:Ca2+-transporting ATPase
VHLGERFLKNTEHLHRDWMLAHEYGLTPELRAMALVWKARDNNAAYVIAAKGSPEVIVDLCHLDAAAQDDITGAVEAMAAEGLRVLAVARAQFAGADFPATAGAIALQAGFDTNEIVSGDVLATMSDTELQARMKTVSILRAYRPEQKLRIV